MRAMTASWLWAGEAGEDYILQGLMNNMTESVLVHTALLTSPILLR